MRWVLGSIVDMPARSPFPADPEAEATAEAPVLRDVEPEAYWDADARSLSVSPRPYDPEVETVPIQAAVFVLPEGSEFAGAGAEELVASPLPRTTTPLPTSVEPEGVSLRLPLPGYDDAVNNAVVLLYGYRA